MKINLVILDRAGLGPMLLWNLAQLSANGNAGPSSYWASEKCGGLQWWERERIARAESVATKSEVVEFERGIEACAKDPEMFEAMYGGKFVQI